MSTEDQRAIVGVTASTGAPCPVGLSADAPQSCHIVQSAPFGVLCVENGRVSWSNRAAGALLGLDPSSLKGRALSAFAPAELAPGALQDWRRADGRLIPIDAAKAPAPAGGDLYYLRDARVEAAARAETARMQRELIRLTRLSSMGEMAAALAHEINQPLLAVAAYAEAAKRFAKTDPSAGERALTACADQAHRAGEIVRRMRQLATRGDGERALEDLSAVIADAGALALAGARDLGVETAIHAPDQPLKVLCDRVQIQQVVVNLVRNAIDALTERPAGAEGDAAPRVEIRIIPNDDEAIVEIRDNGPGVSEAVRDRLFQAFASSKSNGMGLGLNISRAILEAHGGRLWLEPSAEGGATFRFALPLLQDVDAA